MRKIKVTLRTVDKERGIYKYTKDCPFRCWYESLNHDILIPVGSARCKVCKHFGGIVMKDGARYVSCFHPDEIEEKDHLISITK